MAKPHDPLDFLDDATPLGEDSNLQLCQGVYDIAARSFSLPPFERYSSVTQDRPPIYDWVAGQGKVSVSSVVDCVAKSCNLPLFPVYSATTAFSRQAEVVWAYYKQRYGTKRIGGEPWVPLSAIGPVVVMGHYLPDAPDFHDVPTMYVMPVLLTQEHYHAVLQVVAAKETLIKFNKETEECPPLADEPKHLEVVKHIFQYGFCDEESKAKLDYIIYDDNPEKAAATKETWPKNYEAVMRRMCEGVGVFPISDVLVPVEIISRFPNNMCDTHMVIPFAMGSKNIYVATPHLSEYEFEDAVYNQVDPDMTVMRFFASSESVQQSLESAKSKTSTDLSGLAKNAMDTVDVISTEIMSLDDSFFEGKVDNEKSVEHIVYKVLYEAVIRRASDIHIEQFNEVVRFRYRMDGVLITVQTVPVQLIRQVISKIKILSSLDIGQTRMPQDGRLTLRIRDRLVDFRVSIIPVKRDFEKVTLRIIDKSVTIKAISDLRLPPNQQNIFLDALTQDKGLILVTGPTGSGKSSTLYALLNQLNNGSLNLQTIEDPIEQELEGINQTATNNQIGLNFGEMLKRIMRVDPDVIMVGEIRDLETAEAAVQASLTGHLVFSTLHTNDAIRSISRMHNMGVESYLLADSLLLLQAQRLVRVLCRCYNTVPLTDENVSLFEKNRIDIPPNISYLSYPGKCPDCNDSGYKGRVAVMEVIPVGEVLREMISRKASFGEIIEFVQKDPNLFTMYQEGLKRVIQLATSLEEVAPLRAAFT